MFIPEVHGLWARVRVVPADGRPPYEAIVQGYNGNSATSTDRDAIWYWFTSSKDRTDGADARQVQRIVRVDLPGGESFLGIRGGSVNGTEASAEAVRTYRILRLDASLGYDAEEFIAVDPDWVTLL